MHLVIQISQSLQTIRSLILSYKGVIAEVLGYSYAIALSIIILKRSTFLEWRMFLAVNVASSRGDA